MSHPKTLPAMAAAESSVDISQALLVNEENSEPGDSPLSVRQENSQWNAKRNRPDPTTIGDASSDSDDAVFIHRTQAASNRKSSSNRIKSTKKSGGFAAMGFNANLMKAIVRKGYALPTPIQRKTIPMVLDGRDVVGMARTGSGKTAAFVLPMIEKLKAHSMKIGARALILAPSRELALQTLKFAKEFSKGTDLKCVLLVGGDSLEEQFSMMSANPDVLIATPGRFLHLKVEMGLDLSSICYVVFDEADRLFEMGFAAQLTEILYSLPQSRQTLLFSATLPASLVEFARAGLQEPCLVRLDAESKISPDLQSAFFTLKSAEKEGALLHILSDIIKIPTGETEAAKYAKKRKHGELEGKRPPGTPTAHSTLVFVATKHHVEYLASLLRNLGYAVSYVYGSLDQTARKLQVQSFREGLTHILLVTDVAARGIDIPVLANVINYDFPPQPKIFLHRVGRTARAGQRGWSFNLVQDSDGPYLLDLQLFLAKRLVLGQDGNGVVDYTEDMVVGSMIRNELERSCELAEKILNKEADLSALRSVANKAERLYTKTRNAASSESIRRAKGFASSKSWTASHSLFKNNNDVIAVEQEKMLDQVSRFKPSETVFELGKRDASNEIVQLMKKRRELLEAKRRKGQDYERTEAASRKAEEVDGALSPREVALENTFIANDDWSDSSSQQEVEVVGPNTRDDSDSQQQPVWKDSEFFMNYQPSVTSVEDRAYGVHSGSYRTVSHSSNFAEAARNATMDLTNDDGGKSFSEPSRTRSMRWDKKTKKYVLHTNDEESLKGKKMIRGESGQKIAASFRSGRFDAWKKSNRIDHLPRIGESEATAYTKFGDRGKRFRHRTERAPKEADKYRDDYWKKKKMIAAAKEQGRGKFKEGKSQREVRGIDDVRKARSAKEKISQMNRPSKRKRKT